MNAPKPTPPKQRLHVEPSEDTKKLQADIRALTVEILSEKDPVVPVVPKPVVKKPPFVLKPHLTVHPFRESEQMRELEKALNKTKPRKSTTKTQEKK